MHELSIAEAVVDMVLERTGGRSVRCVRIKVGRLAGVVTESLEFCFELATAGTRLEGATLEIDQPAGAAQCRSCGQDFEQRDLILLCRLAYDLLEGYAALVLVDALPGTGEPGAVTVLRVDADDLGSGDVDPHAMAPVAVLASLDRLGGTLPPTYVVGAAPLSLEEGIELSAPVQAAVDEGADAVLRLLAELEVV